MHSTEDDWESHWTQYAAAAQLNPAQRLRHDSILSIIKCESVPVDRLLDVGSGQGDFLARAAAAGIARAYAGFELSKSGVAFARAKNPQAQFVEVDVLAPPAEAARYTGWATTAVCSEVVEHVDDPVAFLSSLRTYLADDATLVLTVPGGPMSKFDRHIGHRQHFTRSGLHRILTDAGFAVKAVRLAGFPFFNLYRLMVILRGQQLVDDAVAQPGVGTSGVGRLAMHAFGLLFHFTLRDFPFGWQLVAVAKKSRR